MEQPRAEKCTDRRRAYYWEQVRQYCGRYRDYHWPSMELILNLVYTHDVLTHSLKAHTKFGLSGSALNILTILHFGTGMGYKQHELGSLLLVSRADVTKVIDGLEKRGLVTRSASQEDRRVKVIRITKAGKTLVQRIIPLQNKESVRVTAGLSAHEIGTLNKLLAKLSAKITENGKAK